MNRGFPSLKRHNEAVTILVVARSLQSIWPSTSCTNYAHVTCENWLVRPGWCRRLNNKVARFLPIQRSIFREVNT
jgi:hypothetical protein